MQRIVKYTYCAIAALLALSCDKVIDDSFINSDPIPIPEKISAQIPTFDAETKSFRGGGFIEDAPESWDIDTRTYAVPDDKTINEKTGEIGEYYQYWSEGDEISLFLTRANLRYKMQGYTDGLLDQGEFRLIGEKLEGSNINTEYFYSIYPYKENTTIDSYGEVTYEFPKIQHYSGDTYANGENGMIAVEPKNGTDSLLFFQNFCSYLQLRLVAIEGQPNIVKKITLTSNYTWDLISGEGIIFVDNGESIPHVKMSTEPGVAMMPAASNQITLDCGSGVKLSSDQNAPTKFWFVVPGDIQFSSGFSVSVIYDNNYYYRKSTLKPIGIQRSHIKPMATFEPIAMEASGPIRYKYNDTTQKEPFPLTNTFFGEGGVMLDVIDQVYDEETDEWVVLLSGTLKTIGDNSFIGPGEDIDYIKVVNGDESVTISTFAFYNCTADSLMVHNPIDQIKADAFKGSTIKDVNIYSNVTSINTGVSADSKIENIIIKGNVGTIREESFNLKGTSVLKSLDIRGSIETIEKKAFYSCGSLEKVNIGGDIKEICEGAFAKCHNLETVEIKGNVDIIGLGAFYDNDNLHTVDITGKVGKIEQHAFYDSDELKTFHTDNGISEIGAQAFASCETLEFVDIHGKVGTIGEEAFANCDNLIKVHITGDIETIDKKAFYDCDGLSELILDGNVNNLEEASFAGCEALKNVTLYGNIETIGVNAFSSSMVEHIHITGSVDLLSDSAFEGCEKLKDVTIDGDITIIKKHAFNGCKELQYISAKSVESIGFEAFIGCSNLTDADLPGIKYIDNAAFQNCTNLASINLDSIITIDDSAFWGCSSLTSIKIGENCTMIGKGAFCGATNLKEVYVYAVNPPFIKTDNTNGSFVFDKATDLCIYVPAKSLELYLMRTYFQNQVLDDPSIQAKSNWWYLDYRSYLKRMTPQDGNLEGWTEGDFPW